MKYKKLLLKIFAASLLLPCLSLCRCKSSQPSETPDTASDTHVSNLPTESASEESLAESIEPSESSIPPVSPEPSDTPATEAPMDSTDNSDVPETTRELSIHLVNTSGVEIGMVSYINPATKEQVDVGALPTGTLLTLDFVWPSEVTEFQWALYNSDGALCMECTTDISAATSSATLILTGESQIESVTAQFE